MIGGTGRACRAWASASVQMAGHVALGLIASAGEIVGTALFLASDASSYLTGDLISFDGG